MSPEQSLLTWSQALWIPYGLEHTGSCSDQTISFLVSLENVLVSDIFFHLLS